MKAFPDRFNAYIEGVLRLSTHQSKLTYSLPPGRYGYRKSKRKIDCFLLLAEDGSVPAIGFPRRYMYAL